MAPPEPYLSPAGTAEAELREKGSRFLAYVAKAADAEAAATMLAEISRRHPDASHHCWARRCGQPARERCSDAGEPTGTAGEPILRSLRGRGLSDVQAVVVRWFGGTKLGKGGLARAYAAVTREALARLPVERRVALATLDLELPYERLGAVKRLLHPPAVTLGSERYGASVELELSIEEALLPEVEAALADLGLHPRRRTEG